MLRLGLCPFGADFILGCPGAEALWLGPVAGRVESRCQYLWCVWRVIHGEYFYFPSVSWA